MIKPINYALNHKNPPMFPSMISIIQQNPWDFPWDFPMFHGIFPGVPWIFPGFPWIFPWISPVVHCPTFHRWIWRRSSSSCPRRRPAWHWRSSRWPAAAAAKDADPEPVGAVKKIGSSQNCLVVTGTMEFYNFLYIGNFIIPTDFNSIIFQRGWWLNHQPVLV